MTRPRTQPIGTEAAARQSREAPPLVRRGILAEDYDGISAFTSVSLAGAGASSAIRAKVVAGAFTPGQITPANTPVLTVSNRGTLEVIGSVNRQGKHTQIQFGSTTGIVGAAIRYPVPLENTLYIDNGEGGPIALFVGGAGDTTANLRIYGSVDVYRTATTNTAFAARVINDAFARWLTQVDGETEWGDGASTRDLRMRRFAAGEMVIDSNSQAVGTRLTVQGTAGQTSDVAVQVAGDSAPRTKLIGDATNTGIFLGDGTGSSDTNAYRYAANVLGTDDALRINGPFLRKGALSRELQYDTDGGATASRFTIEATAGQEASVRVKDAGEAQPRAVLSAANGLVLGDGTTSDTNLYRSAANLLATDDEVEITNAGGKNTLGLTSTAADTGITIGGDSNLYRRAANELATDDLLAVTGNIEVGGNLQLGSYDSSPSRITRSAGQHVLDSTQSNGPAYNLCPNPGFEMYQGYSGTTSGAGVEFDGWSSINANFDRVTTPKRSGGMSLRMTQPNPVVAASVITDYIPISENSRYFASIYTRGNASNTGATVRTRLLYRGYDSAGVALGAGQVQIGSNRDVAATTAWGIIWGVFTPNTDFAGAVYIRLFVNSQTTGTNPGDIWYADDVILREETIPAGVISMWSGSATAVPEGWYLCDGTNGTPNLNDMFIVAVTTGVGGTGGTISPTAAITAHATHGDHGTHTSQGGHTHGSPITTSAPGLTENVGSGAASTVASDTHDHTVTIASGGAHTHDAHTTHSAHSAHEIYKYYKLAYIWKA